MEFYGALKMSDICQREPELCTPSRLVSKIADRLEARHGRRVFFDSSLKKMHTLSLNTKRRTTIIIIIRTHFLLRIKEPIYISRKEGKWQHVVNKLTRENG